MAEELARERILQAATTLFGERVFGNVSVRDIAAKAGVNVSMISYYFGGKEGLRSAVVESILCCIDEAVARVEQAKTPEGAVAVFVRAIVEMHEKNPWVAGLLHQELAHPTGILEERVVPRILRVAGALRHVLQAGVASGAFRSDLPAPLMAYALAAMANYVFLLRPLVEKLLPGIPTQAEAFGAGILSIYLQGVENHERS